MNCAADRCHHIIGGQVRAVMELDAFAQRIANHVWFDILPRGRKRWLGCEVFIVAGQTLIDIVQERDREALGDGIRIHRRDIPGIGELEGFRVNAGGGTHCNCETDRGANQCSFHIHLPAL